MKSFKQFYIGESRAENLKQLASMGVPFRVDEDGTEYYKTEDGYRVEWPDGDMGWYDSMWAYHRVDGPAYINADGRKYWYIHNKIMSEKQFNRRRAKNNPIK